MEKIRFKKLREDASMPERGSSSAAGYDLRANNIEIDGVRFENFALENEDRIDADGGVKIYSGETVMVGTGLAMEIPEGYFGAIFARSGLASKQGLRPGNCVGVVDSDYRGEIKIALHNDTQNNSSFVLKKGERIAQLVIMPYLPVEFEEVDELDTTDRGEGGFGSTGTK